jgi:YVTN family beta-propeller protein
VGLLPLELPVDPQKHTAYVVNSYGDSVSIINTDSETVVATVDAGKRPWDVKVSDDGAYIYVASSASGVINIFSPQQIASASPLA